MRLRVDPPFSLSLKAEYAPPFLAKTKCQFTLPHGPLFVFKSTVSRRGREGTLLLWRLGASLLVLLWVYQMLVPPR